jgi:hypothetical protein
MEDRQPSSNPNTIKLDARHIEAGLAKDMSTGMTSSQITASLTTKSVNTAFTLKKFTNVEDSIEVSDYILELQKAGNEVVNGDLGRLERMLTSQAIALDAMFNRWALKAAGAEYVTNYEVFMRLAFKAQAQSRNTVEALAMIKHPQPYISQTNIGQVGHNQINNINKPAEISQTAPNKLLESTHGHNLDTRAQSQAITSHQAMATMAQVHRSKDC